MRPFAKNLKMLKSGDICPIAQPTQKWQNQGIFAPIFKQSENNGIIATIYKLLYIRNKSIALLCQITSKKLQIRFAQNAETLID